MAMLLDIVIVLQNLLKLVIQFNVRHMLVVC
nr:MAG TPA: hypothetical protein [Crassvirales sp.]